MEALGKDYRYAAFFEELLHRHTHFNGPVERCPAWWHLKDFYLHIKRTMPNQGITEKETAPEE